MTDWKSVLKADPINWLLEKSNPSVRYFTLIELLDRAQDDSEVKDARDDIMSIGTVPKILAVQKEGGYWEKPRMFYSFKYKGTVWQLIILAELGLMEKMNVSEKLASSSSKTHRITRAVAFQFGPTLEQVVVDTAGFCHA